MNSKIKTTFMPELQLPIGTVDIGFYTRAFDAVVSQRWNNDDGSVHAAVLSIDGALFVLHEKNNAKGTLSPAECKGVTTVIGLMVDDMDSVIARAIAAGAKEISPATDYQYGYRQGDILDPFGHKWTIETLINLPGE